MTKRMLVVALATLSLALGGCATKKYVRNQAGPVIEKTNELDDLTAQTSRDIRDTDTRAQQGVQLATNRADAADQKATAARQRADQAQSAADRASQGVNRLSDTVANLDNYRAVKETAIRFGFDKYELNSQARKALDQIGSEIPNARHYVVVVDGNTDSTGPADYNYMLSQRRADAVINYLANKYNVPPHKIYLIGLGKDKPSAPNNTAKGRAENRRVNIRLMTNMDTEATAAKAQKP